MNATPRNGLDEVSFELGRNANGLEALNKSFDQHCLDDDRRHGENVTLLKAINESIAAQNKKIDDRLAIMMPSGELMSRKQIALLALIGTGVMVCVGWILEAFIKWAVGWVLATILKAKIGG